MNRTYNIVWSAARNMYVVASEFSRGSTRPKAQARALVMLALSPFTVQAYTPEVTDETVVEETLWDGDKQNINNGGVASATTVNSGGQQNVNSGGKAVATTINSGGMQSISSGGESISSMINSSGVQEVYDGGYSLSTIVNSGGEQVIYDGIAISTTLNNGGVQTWRGYGSAIYTTINSGGRQGGDYLIAISTTINNGGEQYVYNGGTAKSTIVNSGGFQRLSTLQEWKYTDRHSEATSTTVNEGGVQEVATIGIAIETLLDGGEQYIVDMGKVISTTVNNGGMQYVGKGLTYAGYSGGTAIDTIINDGTQYVYSRGEATSTTINGDGAQYVYSSGVVDTTTVNSGGEQYISGGSATSTTINNGSQYISGGRATSTIINGGVQYIADGSANETTINSGGMQIINGTDYYLSAGNTTVNSGGMQYISDGKAYNATVNSGGIQYVASNGYLEGSVTIEEGGVLSAVDGVIHNDAHLTITEGGIVSGVDDTIYNYGTLIMEGEQGVKDWNIIDGTIDKVGEGSLTLTGEVRSLDHVIVRAGELNVNTSNTIDWRSVDNNGILNVNTLWNCSGYIYTYNDAVTSLNAAGRYSVGEIITNGALSLAADVHVVTTRFSLADGGVLNISLGEDAAAQAAITAYQNIYLGGALNITGTSDITDSLTDGEKSITLIDSATEIRGDFSEVNFEGMDDNEVDFLTIYGHIGKTDKTLYELSATYTWYADKNDAAADAHGTFTLANPEDSYDVNTALVDVDSSLKPDSSSGWDGKTLTKKGEGTLILSGENSYSGGTNIDGGTLLATNTNALGSGDINNSGSLILDADGAFDLTQNIATHTGGVTQIEQDSTLKLNTLTQEDGSSLNIHLDLSSTQPVISARQANLDGDLNITGVTYGPLRSYTGTVTLIDAEQDIQGDFDSLTIAGALPEEVDFINVLGRSGKTDPTHYDLTLGLTWYADSYNSPVTANGAFTINDASQSFTLGAVLEDVAPNDASGWDGQSLTKKGDGTLILDAINTYSGTTSVQDGALWLDTDAVIGVTGSQQRVDVAQGAAFGGDNARVNGVVENNGTLYFDNKLTVNGDVINNGAIQSGSGDIPLVKSMLTSTGQPNNTLVINGDYIGNGGSLSLNTYLGDDSSPTDKLIVNGDTSGDTTLYIRQAGGKGAQTINGIEVIEVNGTSDGNFVQGNQVQAGLYEYRLYEEGGDWYLRSLSVLPPDDGDDGDDDDGGDNTPVVPDDGGDNTPIVPDDGGDNTPIVPDDGGDDTPVVPDNGDNAPQYRADIGAYLGNQWMARNLQMQTLYDRQGSQYRTSDGSVWARMKAGRSESRAAEGNVNIDSDYSLFQIGSDIVAWNNGEQSFNVGLMGSYINARTDSTGNRGADGSRFSANGSINGYNLGMYATWFANAQTHSGMYIDTWYQYGIYDNSVDNGDVGSTRYDSHAHAISLESGYRFDIALDKQSSISLTPQAQVTWQKYSADSVTDNNGTRIDGQNSNSWNTRLGMRATGNLYKGANTVIQPYMEANWLHTSDNVSVSFDGTSVKQDTPANRGELKLGIDANIDSQWSVRAQVSGQKGSNGYSDLGGSLNLRYSW